MMPVKGDFRTAELIMLGQALLTLLQLLASERLQPRLS